MNWQRDPESGLLLQRPAGRCDFISCGPAFFSAGGGAPSPSDPYFSNVVLLNPFNGNLTDYSSAANPMSLYGSASLSTAYSRWGSRSLLACNGGAITNSAITTLDMGTGDLTLEMWVLIPSTVVTSSNDTASLFVYGAQDISVVGGYNFAYIPTQNKLRLEVDLNHAAASVILVVSSIADGNWHHIGYCRASGVSYFALDGSATNVGTGLSGVSFSQFGGPNQSTIGVGRDGLGNPQHEASNPGVYISDSRATKGVARYTSAYTVPTGPFPHH